MKLGKLSCILVLIIASIAFAAGIASAETIPVELLEIELDNTELHSGINILDVEKGDKINIDVKIMANMSTDYVQIKASISGYDYPDREKVSDKTSVFDVEPNVTYWKSLDLEIPESMDDDMYKLRIVISDRANDENSYTYDLSISSERHSMQIKDAIFSPEYGVEAGKVFQAKLRIKNTGQKDEESVKVRVNIPDLGISGSDYIDMIESGETESSEEIWLRVPECAESGFYDAIVSVIYDEGYSTVSSTESLAVTGGKCAVDKPSAASGNGNSNEGSSNSGTITNYVNSGNTQQNSNSQSTEASRKDIVRKMLESSLIVLVIARGIAGLVIGVIIVLREG